jgi:hypothetical protein
MIVNSSVSGVVLYNSQPEMTVLMMTLGCNTLDRTGHAVSVSNKSQNGQFNFLFSPLATYDGVLGCWVATEGTPQIRASNTSIGLKQPDFSGK